MPAITEVFPLRSASGVNFNVDRISDPWMGDAIQFSDN